MSECGDENGGDGDKGGVKGATGTKDNDGSRGKLVIVMETKV